MPNYLKTHQSIPERLVCIVTFQVGTIVKMYAFDNMNEVNKSLPSKRELQISLVIHHKRREVEALPCLCQTYESTQATVRF